MKLTNLEAVIAVFAFNFYLCASAAICYIEPGRTGLCTEPNSCPSDIFAASPLCKDTETCCLHPHHVDKRSTNNTKKKKKKKDKVQVTPTTPPSPPPDAIPNLRARGCGVRRTLMDFVIGGQDADYWPWVASIFVKAEDSPESVFTCGATVISKRYLLTAAHCVVDGRTVLSPRNAIVRVGGLTADGDGRVYRVDDIKTHERYRSNVHYDDIAVLRLTEEINSKRVVPACLPTPGMYNANFYGRNGTILGWGLTEVDGSLSTTLQEATVSIVSNKRCQSKYRRLGAMSLPRGITETHICAGTENGTKDACQGDSGGPLLVADRSDKWNVVGIVSFGYGCAESEYPGVYTRVAKYLPWLRDNTDIPATYF